MSCPDCTAGELLPGEPTGILSTLGAYLSPSPGSNEPSRTAVVLLTDVFGLPLKNPKIIADNLAKQLGCDVWVPDYFAGGTPTSTFETIRFYLSMLPRIPAVIASRPAVADERIANFIKTIRDERKYEKVGAIGYCYGGAAAVRLGAIGLVESLIICHPGPITIAQVKAIKAPTAWVCAEDDQFFVKSLRLSTEAVFAERQGTEDYIDYEFRDYKGTVHGFAIRPNLTIPDVKEAFEKYTEQATFWFSKTLIV